MVIFGVVVVEKEGGASKSSATPSGQTPPARSNVPPRSNFDFLMHPRRALCYNPLGR